MLPAQAARDLAVRPESICVCSVSRALDDPSFIMQGHVVHGQQQSSTCWDGFEVAKEVAKHQGMYHCRAAHKATTARLSLFFYVVHSLEGLLRAQCAFEALQDADHELFVLCCILSRHLLPLLSSLHSVHQWHGCTTWSCAMTASGHGRYLYSQCQLPQNSLERLSTS